MKRKLEISEETVEQLKKKHYELEKQGAVQICSWTNKALRKEGVCYKQKFYGIHCHKCMQFTPLAVWCNQNCIFCWRPNELMKFIKPKEIDKKNLIKPFQLIEGLIKKRKKLLIGFKGYAKKIGAEKIFEDSLVPNHFAISLSGEPTIYPFLPELIKFLKEKYKARSVFLVTNGQEVGMLKKLKRKRALPHQLYLSLIANNKDDFLEIAKPCYKDAWKRLLKSLRFLKKLRGKTRRVLRITIIKDINDSNLEKWVEFIKKTEADFIEIKAYMHLGYSIKRLKKENMPPHSEIKKIANKLGFLLSDYEYCDEDGRSRIVLLKNKNKFIKQKFE